MLRVQSPVTPLLILGGQNVKSVNHYQYLGTILNTELSDATNIQRQLRHEYCAANKLRASFSRCSNVVKNVLLRSFCTPMYARQLWCNFRKSRHCRHHTQLSRSCIPNLSQNYVTTSTNVLSSEGKRAAAVSCLFLLMRQNRYCHKFLIKVSCCIT